MLKVAVYGKGGIGKSTTVSNVAAALALRGLKVVQIGCDPKADSTYLLMAGRRIPTVLDLMRTGRPLSLRDVVHEGFAGVQCVEAGGTFMTVRGRAADLHAAWKVCLNVFDHCSAVATKTRAMVDAAHAQNPHCEVLTTRKSMPGAKDLLTEAVMAGGAFPHRLGLSETVLVFDHHLTLFGGFDAFVDRLPDIRSRCIEKKLFVEADAARAVALARAGVDGVQVDKVAPDELAPLVAELRAIDPRLTIIAAGGIDAGNAGAYAATGVDGLATTAPFTAKPLDMSAKMERLPG